MHWATFWAIFSHTHLVTLLTAQNDLGKSDGENQNKTNYATSFLKGKIFPDSEALYKLIVWCIFLRLYVHKYKLKKTP
jgi:hypothetical protein